MTKSNWKKIKLTDVADVVGGGTPSTKEASYWNGNVPWLTPKDLSGYSKRYISSGERNISKSGLDNSSAVLLPASSVLLTSRAPIGYIAIAKNPIATNQGFKSLVLKRGHYPEFYYYLLKANVEYIRNMGSGSTFKEVSGSVVKELTFLVPEYDEQKRIVEVLGAFDDKIELLQKQNKTLEEMAKAIFKSWFVDFDIVKAKQKGEKKEEIIKNYHLTEELYNLFPSSFVDSALGPIPTGWELGKLSDIANILGGFAFKSKDFTNKGIPVIKIKNIQDNHLVNFEDVQYVSENIKARSEKFVLKDSDIVMAMTGATIGKFALVINKDVPSLLNQRVAKISAKDESIHWFVYFSLLQNNVEEQVKNNGLGSAQPNISAERIGDSSVIIPKLQVEKIFNSFVKKIMEKFISNIKQIQTLTELRDTLLPRLISGKIKV